MNFSNFNRTKIIATIGPASIDEKIMESMISAGLDVCRINSSHGDYDMMERVIITVRRLNERLNTHTAILFDLQGPKIRIGDIPGKEILITPGDELYLNHKNTENLPKGELYIKYPHFHQDVKVGDSVLIDDGKLVLEVQEIMADERVRVKVIHGGPLSSRKGVNLPNTIISLPSLTEKDRNDLDFALKHNVEWIGLSFVRKPEDVQELKSIIRSRNSISRVIAKIEKPEAVKHIDEIIDEADGIMVARGDLGVELPMEQVPVVQKTIVSKCRQASKPVIIATQMMESMIQNHRPTRAEANDVCNAVFDGADALMLSGETSIGRYPVETVQAMQKIIHEVETLDSIYFKESIPKKDSLNFIPEHICYVATVMAKQANATAIAAMTHSGTTAFKVAAHRPKAHILIFTDNRPLLNTLNLVWGVRGFYYDKYESTDRTISDIQEFLVQEKYVKKGDYMINIASMPLHERTTTNTMKLTRIE